MSRAADWLASRRRRLFLLRWVEPCPPQGGADGIGGDERDDVDGDDGDGSGRRAYRGDACCRRCEEAAAAAQIDDAHVQRGEQNRARFPTDMRACARIIEPPNSSGVTTKAAAFRSLNFREARRFVQFFSRVFFLLSTLERFLDRERAFS